MGKPPPPPRLPLAGFHYDALFATQNCHKQKRLQYRLTRGDLYYHDHPVVTWLLIGQRDCLEAWPRTPGGRWIILISAVYFQTTPTTCKARIALSADKWKTRTRYQRVRFRALSRDRKAIRQKIQSSRL